MSFSNTDDPMIDTVERCKVDGENSTWEQIAVFDVHPLVGPILSAIDQSKIVLISGFILTDDSGT